MMVGDNFVCDVLGPLALGMQAAWVDIRAWVAARGPLRGRT